MIEGEKLVEKNLSYFTRNEIVSIFGAYVISGYLKEN